MEVVPLSPRRGCIAFPQGHTLCSGGTSGLKPTSLGVLVPTPGLHLPGEETVTGLVGVKGFQGREVFVTRPKEIEGFHGSPFGGLL
jgi:hypothetical protein